LLVGVTVMGGAEMALFASPLGKLMIGGEVEPFAAAAGLGGLPRCLAAGLPYVVEVVARKLSRAVLHDEARRFGVELVAVALLAGVSLMTVPWLMALGGVSTHSGGFGCCPRGPGRRGLSSAPSSTSRWSR
jgi:hypothetical protein